MKRSTATSTAGARGHDTIEVHVRDLAQLFDSLDPYPFYERDLDPDAEEYIVASAHELDRNKPCRIIIYLDEFTAPADPAAAERAVQAHFARRARLERRELGRLMRQGSVSLFIGISFLGLLLLASEMVVTFLGAGTFARLLSESLVIGGWVAMWRPLEIFLYDWWPILGRARTFERLAALPVHLEGARAAPPGTSPRSQDPPPF